MTHSSDDNLQFDFHVIWRPLMASMCTCINAAQKLMQIYKNINTDTKKSIIQKINTFQNVICYQVGILSFIYLATIQNHTLEVYTRKTCILIFLGITRSKFPTGSLSTKGLYLPCVIVSIFVLPVTEWPSSSISLLGHYFHQDAPCWSFKLYYLSKVSPLTTISLSARTLMYEW